MSDAPDFAVHDVEPEEGTSIWIASGVNDQGKGFCPVHVGDRQIAQMTPNGVRKMALQWLEAAEAAEHDAAVWRLLLLLASNEGRDLEEAKLHAGRFVGQLRNHREFGNHRG